jgi:hypothetical protein
MVQTRRARRALAVLAATGGSALAFGSFGAAHASADPICYYGPFGQYHCVNTPVPIPDHIGPGITLAELRACMTEQASCSRSRCLFKPDGSTLVCSHALGYLIYLLSARD